MLRFIYIKHAIEFHQTLVTLALLLKPCMKSLAMQKKSGMQDNAFNVTYNPQNMLFNVDYPPHAATGLIMIKKPSNMSKIGSYYKMWDLVKIGQE